MNKPLGGLLAILIIALAIFAALSVHTDGLELGSSTLKTASFAETLFSPVQASENPKRVATRKTAATRKDGKATTAVPAAPVHPKGWRAPMDTTSKTILFIGDSMLEGLGPRLAAYAKHNGHTLVNVIWYSSTTEVWGRTTKLKEYINQFKPNYVFVCLGANELFVSDIKKKRQRYLDNMLSQIGNIPYVWIGPPNWKPDTGINDMLEASCADGSFFLSNGQHFDRAKDGANHLPAIWTDMKKQRRKQK